MVGAAQSARAAAQVGMHSWPWKNELGYGPTPASNAAQPVATDFGQGETLPPPNPESTPPVWPEVRAEPPAEPLAPDAPPTPLASALGPKEEPHPAPPNELRQTTRATGTNDTRGRVSEFMLVGSG